MTARRWIALLVVGAVVALTTPFPYSYGWTAYSPLTDVTYSPGPPRWSLLAIAVPLLVGGFVSGLAVASLRAGRRAQKG